MNPGELYHVYNRGNNKENIFKAGANYDYFLQLFDRHLSKLTYLHAYCLMPNHFHLLVEVRTSIEGDTDSYNDNGKLKPVEKGFKNFFIAYVKAINRVYGRTGSLFQSKFKRKLIEGEFQYQTNVAYIVSGRKRCLSQIWVKGPLSGEHLCRPIFHFCDAIDGK